MGLAQRKINFGGELPLEELMDTAQIVEIGDDTKKAANEVMGGGLRTAEEMAPNKEDIEASDYTRTNGCQTNHHYNPSCPSKFIGTCD